MNSGRIWFKEDMAKAILDGRKTSTTRDHDRGVGEFVAVVGDYYHAKPFARIRVTAVEQTTWAKVFRENWREEGFNSPNHMSEWCEANGLAHATGTVYLHRFVVVSVPSIIKSRIGEGT